MKGHMGKILRLDLDNRSFSSIDTSKYEKWVGGIGIGLALFWDEVDKNYLTRAEESTGFEPENVICLMTGPLQGTLAPNGGRTEVCGIGPESYPRPQFTRGNFGGRFAAMLKFAGWDGIVIKGKADRPVWIDIRDGEVRVNEANHLWGLGTYDTQEEIWREVHAQGYQQWYMTNSGRDSGRTTQRPAIVTIGQAGENLARLGCLIHDAGNAAGQGGFGAVFGSKNLKAISVIGTGSVEVADPAGLLEAREWLLKYNYDVDSGARKTDMIMGVGSTPAMATVLGYGNDETFGRALGCFGCARNCRANVTNSRLPGGESQCVEALFYQAEDVKRHGKGTEAGYIATKLLEDYGINAYELFQGMHWLESLYERGLLGRGKMIHTELEFEKLGTQEFAEDLLRSIAFKEDIGADLAEGITRAAAKWGVLEQDLMSGLLQQIFWIGEVHHGDCLHWAYESIFSARDINQHDLSHCAGQKIAPGLMPPLPAKALADRMAELGAPWHDPRMITQGENDVYSIHMARVVAWHRRYDKFWKNSTQFCDWWVPSFFNKANPDGKGISPEIETRFFRAVTGVALSYQDGLELGRKMWNFERAILVLQGRHRSEEYFPPFPPYDSYVYSDEPPYLNPWQYPVYDEEKKEYRWEIGNFPIRKDKMDEFKTTYYNLEGWDTETGRPTRQTLEGCGLKYVADELEARGKLPK